MQGNRDCRSASLCVRLHVSLKVEYQHIHNYVVENKLNSKTKQILFNSNSLEHIRISFEST